MTDEATTRTDAGTAGQGRRDFAHDRWVWGSFPRLRAVAATVQLPSDGEALAPLREIGAGYVREVLEQAQRPVESAVEPIKAWRSVLAATGVRPTQYRCAAESLLRRLRTRGELPVLHPLVDLCNGLSVRWAVPVAVFDLERVDGSLRVARSRGEETHTTFDGGLEHPEPGEVTYLDDAGHAHSRRWCWRQSAHSVVHPGTRHALVVAEAVHDRAEDDVLDLGDALTTALGDVGITTTPVLLTADAPSLPLPSDREGPAAAPGDQVR